MKNASMFAAILLWAGVTGTAQEVLHRKVIPSGGGTRQVSDEVMARVFAEVKTPFKYGIVIRGEEGDAVDCPSVFRHAGHWYMVYIRLNKVGYETQLATSDDLLSWRTLGKILPFRQGTWDARQAAGFIALEGPDWNGSHQLRKFDGKYWLSYCGGALPGYETDPLAIGIAWTHEPDQPREWTRLDRPVLSKDQPDVRDFERLTQYRSNIILDRAETLGYPFVMFYNAKTVSGYERIGMAVSRDMKIWLRYGNEAVIDNGKGISGDPQIVRLGDVWVMFYFGAFWKPAAFDTFACSYDLVHWKKWDGPDLVRPSEPWDKQFAHKPWLLKHEGVVYHFYCAVGDRGRVIALATSRDPRKHTEVHPAK
ncbi:MAG: glycosylase [Isosphaeraceae bacterium]